MASLKTSKTTVKGGEVFRNARSGKFSSVKTAAGSYVKRPNSEKTVKEVSIRRASALKRLVNR